jgi:hypothetical protein
MEGGSPLLGFHLTKVAGIVERFNQRGTAGIQGEIVGDTKILNYAVELCLQIF